MGCGTGAGFGRPLVLVLIRPPRYCAGGLGEVADLTDGDSYGRAERLGDREYRVCDAVAMVLVKKSLLPAG